MRDFIFRFLPYRLRPLFLMNELILLEGPERHSGLPFVMLISGDGGIKDFYKRHAFSAEVTERSLGNIPMWLTPKLVRFIFKKADIVIWWAHPMLERFWPRPAVDARLPTWSYLEIDLQSPESLKRGNEKYKRYRNLAIKSGYEFELAKSKSDYILFYDEMFIPYITGRHGANAVIKNRDDFLSDRISRNFNLYLLRLAGESIAGVVLEFSESVARFLFIGMRSGVDQKLRSGITNSLYYYMISKCRDLGYKTLNLGSCRPFIRDGIFEYKRLVGGHPAAARFSEAGSMEMTILEKTPGALSFLSENPMVAMTGSNEFSLYVFTAGATDAQREHIDMLKNRYCFMDTISIRAFDLSVNDNRCWYDSSHMQ